MDRLIKLQELQAELQAAKSTTLVDGTALAVRSEEARYEDKVNAIAGIKFEKKLPVIKDTDLNLDRHLREFDNVLRLHTHGRIAVRPMDRWHLYKASLQENGIRWRIYMHEDRVAQRRNRFPDEAKEVFEETVQKQKDRLRETDLKKRERIDAHSII